MSVKRLTPLHLRPILCTLEVPYERGRPIFLPARYLQDSGSDDWWNHSRSMARIERRGGPGTGSDESDGDFHWAHREPTLEFSWSLCCGTAKGALDSADRSAGSARDPAPLFSYCI